LKNITELKTIEDARNEAIKAIKKYKKTTMFWFGDRGTGKAAGSGAIASYLIWFYNIEEDEINGD